MRNALSQRVMSGRHRTIAVAIVLAVGAAMSASVALGRVDLGSTQAGSALVQSPDLVAIVTGGGTVEVTASPQNVLASFGLNARRPVGFTGGGGATGRISYDKHTTAPSHHVNVPVVLMEAAMSATPSANGTGGAATLSGDCGAVAAECPSNAPAFQSVLVYVEDNSDSGANSDVFKIFYCTVAPFLPPGTFNGTTAPANCQGPEGGTLRTGNIQVRQSITGGAASVPTAARAPFRLP